MILIPLRSFFKICSCIHCVQNQTKSIPLIQYDEYIGCMKHGFWFRQRKALIFNSDGDFHHFMRDISKTGFSSFAIKTAVHRAQYCVSCGRHRFSRIFINAKICWNISWLHHCQFPLLSKLYENNENRTMRALSGNPFFIAWFYFSITCLFPKCQHVRIPTAPVIPLNPIQLPITLWMLPVGIPLACPRHHANQHAWRPWP